MIQKYLAAQALRIDGNFLRASSPRPIGSSSASGSSRSISPCSGCGRPRADAAGRHDHRHDRGRRVSRRHAALSEPAAAVRDGQPLSPGRNQARASVCRPCLRCGHWNQGRDGNKTACQSFGIWFARHGYICLIIDSLQLGEIAATHHGTYNFDRWWWHSRGYTPGRRRVLERRSGDRLPGRAATDVDPQRIAVTGISGGGAATFWIAAADERVKVAVPSSGMADLEATSATGDQRPLRLHVPVQHVPVALDAIAALVAPARCCSSTATTTRIFPMDANRRITNRLERMYSLYGAGDVVDSLVQHRRPRLSARHSPGRVPVSECHAQERSAARGRQRNGRLGARGPAGQAADRRGAVAGVSLASRHSQRPAEHHDRRALRADCPGRPAGARRIRPLERRPRGPARRLPLRTLARSGAAGPAVIDRQGNTLHLATEEGIEIYVEQQSGPPPATARRVLLIVRGEDSTETKWPGQTADDAVLVCQTRGSATPVGRARTRPTTCCGRWPCWAARSIPAALWDVMAAARYIEGERAEADRSVCGAGSSAALAAYAGLLDRTLPA